jgi:hypothetical protein
VDRLRELARRELRDPKTQAAYLILSGLRAAGLEPDVVRAPSRQDMARDDRMPSPSG